MNDKYCPGCSVLLEVRSIEGKEHPVCPQCERVIYYDPKIVAAALIERNGQVLIIRRAVQVGYGLWSLPGGYVDRGEIVENAAAREVFEETGLKVKTDKLLGLFSEQGNPVLVAAYTAIEIDGDLEAGPEALELGFYSPNNLPDLAFPRDQLIIDTWLSSLNL